MSLTRIICSVGAAVAALWMRAAWGDGFRLSYGGRLSDATGAPVTGTVDLEVRIYATGDATVPTWTRLVEGVELSTGGVFQLELEPPIAALGSATAPVWIELYEPARSITYPRQKWLSVPYAAVAASVPVDGATLGFDANGRLTVLAAPGSGSVPNPLPAVDGAALTNVDAAALRGAPVDATSPATGQVLKWSGSAWTPAADTDTTNPGTVTSVTAGSGLTGGTITGSGTIGLAATLPAVDGSALTGVNAVKLQSVTVDTAAPVASQVLKYDGDKWAPATDANSGGTVTSITAGSGLTGGTITGTGTIALASPMPALDGGALTNVNAVKIQGRVVSSTMPTDGHVLKWNASASTWEAAPDDGGVAGAISAGQNLGTSDQATADIYESTSAPNIRFRRLREGAGVELTQNASDVTVSVAAGGITSAELAADSVDSAAISADAVTAAKIAADAVGSSEIAAGAVGNSELAADAVTSAKIQDGQVQTADLAANAVTTSEILDGTITGGDVSPSAALSVASIGVSSQAGVTLSPFDTGAGNTAEARFKELSANGSNFVALKAPDALAADVTYTLPSAAPASNGQILSGTTVGALSWTSLPTALPPSGAAGGDLNGSYPNPTLAASGVTPGTYPKVTVDAKGRVTSGSSTITASDIADGTIADADVSGDAAIATSKLSGAVTSIVGNGLGTLASLSVVGGSEITDGSIANADISGTAAIATSKLSGVVTSISGHGLGSLATASAVGSAEITDGAVSSADIADGTIANADISGTAAIATSKLSGAITSITGHGLGSLATLSSVGSAEITNGTIADADVSGTAAIATSKLSGAVTSIAGHGLGALATSSAVGSAQITDGSITDADISGTAAISSTKITFVAGSISGNAVSGGVISDFQSTGIDDKAAAVALTINSSGNVGIGTTSPVSTLHVSGASLVGSSAANQTNVSLNSGGPAGTRNISIYYQSGGTNGSASGDYSVVQSGYGGVAYTAIALNPNGGNVGIGTTSPGATLDVNGAVRVKKYSSEPFACSATTDAAVATTSNYTMCICKSGTGWVQASDGSTTCYWQTQIVTYGSGRRWSDGTYATSCNGYKNPTAPYTYSGQTGDGVYTIDPDGAGASAAFDVRCDMTTDGGGWTIVYGSTGGDGEGGLTSNSESTAGNPMSFQYYNLSRQKKVDISALSTESMVRRSNSQFLSWNSAMFTPSLTTATQAYSSGALTCRTGSAATATCYAAWSNYNISGGGDFGVTTNGFDHHSTNYYKLNNNCVGHLFYSYSATSLDGDQGYEVNSGLTGWSTTVGCSGNESGHMSFYAGMR